MQLSRNFTVSKNNHPYTDICVNYTLIIVYSDFTNIAHDVILEIFVAISVTWYKVSVYVKKRKREQRYENSIIYVCK